MKISQELLKDSYEYEGDKENIPSVDDMPETTNIEEMYKFLFPKSRGAIRRCPIFVGNHRGVSNEYLAEAVPKLQEMIDKVQGKSLMERYIVYIIYERIHPHLDGNGRMGRILLLDDADKFPFSSVLNHSKMASRLHIDIFQYTVISKAHVPLSQYFDTSFLTPEVLTKIELLIRCVSVYKLVNDDDIAFRAKNLKIYLKTHNVAELHTHLIHLRRLSSNIVAARS